MHCAQVLFTLLLFHVPVFVLSHVGTCPRGARCGAVPCSPLSKGTREWISEHLLPSAFCTEGYRRQKGAPWKFGPQQEQERDSVRRQRIVRIANA